MLLNLSNHPFSQWAAEQQQVARQKYGEIRDLPFPNVDPDWDTDRVERQAGEYAQKILLPKPAAVHIMGEFTFTFALVARLQQSGIPCITSTTERIVSDKGNGKREYTFRFVRFREYPACPTKQVKFS